MSQEIMNKAEKRKVLERLNETFGIKEKELNYLFSRTSKGKIRGFSGNLSRDELFILAKNFNVESIGVQLFTIDNDITRIKFDAANLLKEKISKNIININKEQAFEWMKGNDLEMNEEQLKDYGKFIVLKYNDDFLGTGKNTGKKILNYVPKEHRMRKQEDL